MALSVTGGVGGAVVVNRHCRHGVLVVDPALPETRAVNVQLYWPPMAIGPRSRVAVALAVEVPVDVVDQRRQGHRVHRVVALVTITVKVTCRPARISYGAAPLSTLIIGATSVIVTVAESSSLTGCLSSSSTVAVTLSVWTDLALPLTGAMNVQ